MRRDLGRESVERGPYAQLSWLLKTADAHGLYAKFGFTRASDRVLERPPRR